jgi:hypothetical protein
VRGYLRLLLVLVLVNYGIRAAAVMQGTGFSGPELAGHLTGWLVGLALVVVGSVAALSGHRWGFRLVGILGALGVVIGLRASGRVLASGHEAAAMRGLLICLAHFGIACGLVFLDPAPREATPSGTSAQAQASEGG